ncbi:hypothetical protein FE840_013890 [Peteryoungia desertarenae]|uniref:Uncharacterized protein n=1 Tax=Peteryoungia desertarenae TaxID=1813451 RepID=A0ABX6QQK7_9HYPH|nr:DUF6074 family protein [Peteryoungia desertarenae]QLF70537.1 hypothetical protein FE840_013890 [Peteryoungia desertarenae]
MKQDGMISHGAGSISHFPLARMADLVRRSACALDRLNGPPANAFWRSLCADLKTELFHQGLSYDEARAEILDFQEAVHRELVQMHAGAGQALNAAAR